MLSGIWDDKWISGFGRFTISLASAVCPPSATSMSHCNTLFASYHCCSVIISAWHVIESNRHKKDKILLPFISRFVYCYRQCPISEWGDSHLALRHISAIETKTTELVAAAATAATTEAEAETTAKRPERRACPCHVVQRGCQVANLQHRSVFSRTDKNVQALFLLKNLCQTS